MIGRDWIKAYHGLSRSLEVVQIAGETGRSRQEVVGFMIDLWQWVDCESLDGRVRGVTLAQISELVGGDEILWNSVKKAGWIRCGKDWILIPGWDEVNSGSRKQRERERIKKRRQRGCPGDVPGTSGGTREGQDGDIGGDSLFKMGDDGWMDGSFSSSSMKKRASPVPAGDRFLWKALEVVERVRSEEGRSVSASDVHNAVASAIEIRRKGKRSNLWGTLTQRLRGGRWAEYDDPDDEAARRLLKGAVGLEWGSNER